MLSDHTTQEHAAVAIPRFIWAYTRNVTSFAHRLTCFAMAFALSGSPAALSVCLAQCLDSPVAAASVADGAQADHNGHGTTAEPAVTSPHAHSGSSASTRPSARVTNASPLPPSDARLVGSCESCCIAGPVAFVAGPGVERTDAKAFGLARAIQVVSFHVSVATRAGAPRSAPVSTPRATGAPLALRI